MVEVVKGAQVIASTLTGLLHHNLEVRMRLLHLILEALHHDLLHYNLEARMRLLHLILEALQHDLLHHILEVLHRNLEVLHKTWRRRTTTCCAISWRCICAQASGQMGLCHPMRLGSHVCVRTFHKYSHHG